MLHGTKNLRHGSAALTVLLGLLVTIVTPASAHALNRPTRHHDLPTVRLVENTDGSLEVLTGSAFASAGATVLVEEPDTVLRTTLLDTSWLLNRDGLANDELRDDQWGLTHVGAERAWTRTHGEGQVIAIVDSGVDGEHPDLRDRLVDGVSTTGGDELVDGHGHGTHVAGTAAASAGDRFGVAGLAHGANIMPVQVTDPDGLAYASDVAEGLLWAVQHGATVANLSLAGTQESRVLSRAIDFAVDRGVVVVVAAGNEYNRGNPATYPAAHPSVIAVGALRDAHSRSSFSSTGDFVDLAAPGSSILSDRPGGVFGYASGTSMAAPLVAGAVALLRTLDPDLDPEGVADALTVTATDLGATGRDDEFGHGGMDLLAAMEAVAPSPEPDPLADPVETLSDTVDGLVDDALDGAVDGTEAPLPSIDPITQTLTDGSWLSQGWGLG